MDTNMPFGWLVLILWCSMAAGGEGQGAQRGAQNAVAAKAQGGSG
jgi:hypothetical protein